MPVSKLIQLVKDEDYDGFETLCLEKLESGDLRLADLVEPFKELDNREHAERAAAIGQMMLESVDLESDPAAALEIARYALLGDPKNDELLRRVATLYRQVHGDKPGFDALLKTSGLESGRPVRNALRLLEVCLTAEVGDPMLSRTEDEVVEVMEIDLEHGLFTLRTRLRPKTITSLEFSREYERIAPDDFRVLRAFKPESVTELIESDPVGVVVGILHAHGELMDQDVLKSELTPKYLPTKSWSKWWSSVKTKLQRYPHVIIEGRNPLLLRYTKEAWTLEDATWDMFQLQKDPADWLAALESYPREKKKRKETPNVGMLARCKQHVDQHREAIQKHRPSEALGCLLVSQRIDVLADELGEPAAPLALKMLQECDNPAELISGIRNEALYADALKALAAARPDDAARWAAELLPSATAGLLDRLVAMTRNSEAVELVQSHIETAMANPIDAAEIMYWLWKGPKDLSGLPAPDYDELFTSLIRTLRALGRTLNPDHETVQHFRRRIRSAFTLRSYERVNECIRRVAHDRAVTLRTQLERLEGMGDNVRYKLLNMLSAAHPNVFVVRQARIEPWEDQNVLWCTADGLKRKTGEREHLVNVEMHENARRIGEAASHGDLSENSEYKFALEERDFLRARLAQMNKELSIAEVLEEHMPPADHVGVGSRVTLRDVSSGVTREMTFLGSFETDVEKGIFNYKAPVSQSLMGLHPHDRKELTFDNRTSEFEIVEIANGLRI